MWWTGVTGSVFPRDGRSWRMTRPRKWSGTDSKVHVVICRGCQIYLTYGKKFGIEPVGFRLWVGGPPQDGGRYSEVREWMRKREIKSDGTKGPVHLAPIESTFFQTLHPIVAHCATARYSDGSPRRPGWITVSTAGSSWTLTAKEPDVAAQLRVTAATLDEALELLACLLDAEDAPWEPDRFLQEQSRKKK